MPIFPEHEAALFALIAEKPVAEREAILNVICGDDDALRRRLEVLVAAHDAPDAGLDIGPAVARVSAARGAGPQPEAAVADAALTRMKPADDESVGQTLGRYKLLEKVGEGGCGVVYVAEQTEPVRRRVALKVIKLGMDTKDVVARFEAERQALAMMDHPNIARVFDAGATETGRPYFVMELVRGIRITDYCDEARLSTAERLDLFINVCHAVQHAHQKGIIHRDLKPSNILVTLHDGMPVPKVIDFGIAKATGERLTNATIYTRLHQFIGTPAYMSPEQAEMSGLDIDTRSDVYSLGVLLYELLAGSPPFDSETLLASGLDAMRRTIREVEPPRPSTRLAALKGEERTTTAKRHAADAAKLVHQLQGDLDWIVMKCLEKDRGRRYETANSLATDLKRHLSNEPVTARPPSAAYRFQKAWHRNKLAFSAAAAVGVAIIAGAVVSYIQADRARKAEALAKARLEEAEQVAQFLQQVFQSPDPEKDGLNTTVADALERAAAKLETDLADQPERRAKLQATLASTCASLGMNDAALRLREKVRDFWLRTSGPDDPQSLTATRALASSNFLTGQLQTALQLLEDLLPRIRRVHGDDHADTLSAVIDYANVLDVLGRDDEALKLRETSLAEHRRVLGPEHRSTITAMNNYGVSLTSAGLTKKALQNQEELVAICTKTLGPEHPITLNYLDNLGNDYIANDRLDDAIKVLETTVEAQRRIIGPKHPKTIHAMQTLGAAYHKSGRKEEGLKLREQVLELTRKIRGPEHFTLLSLMQDLAQSYSAAERTGEARKLLEDSITLGLKLHGPEHNEVLESEARLAELHCQEKRFDDALRLAEEVVPLIRKVKGPEHHLYLNRAILLANCYVSVNRYEEAIPLWKEVLAACQKKGGPDQRTALSVLRRLADAYAATGRPEEALKASGEALTISQKLFEPEHVQVIRSLDYLAYFNHRAGRSEEAVQFGEQMLVLSRKVIRAEDSVTIYRSLQLANYYSRAGKVDQALQLGKEAISARRKTSGPEDAATVDAIMAVADVYAEHGRWSEARTELVPLMAMKQLPDSATTALMSLAVLDVFLAERSDYEVHCAAMLTRFGSANDSEIDNRIAKACLLLPLDTGKRAAAVELAERGVRLGEKSSLLSWYLLAQALAQYRSGAWSDAVASGARSQELSNDAPNPTRSAAVLAIVAMARHQLGQTAEARASLEAARDIADWPDPAKGIPGSWHNVLIACVLMQEATGLIEGPAPKTDR